MVAKSPVASLLGELGVWWWNEGVFPRVCMLLRADRPAGRCITEYPEVEMTQKDHPVKLPAPQVTSQKSDPMSESYPNAS